MIEHKLSPIQREDCMGSTVCCIDSKGWFRGYWELWVSILGDVVHQIKSEHW